MAVDIDNIAYEIVEAVTFDELIYLADKLDVEHDEQSWLDDMWPEQEEELKQKIQEALARCLDSWLVLLKEAQWAYNAIKPFSKEPSEQSGIIRLKKAIAMAQASKTN